MTNLEKVVTNKFYLKKYEAKSNSQNFKKKFFKSIFNYKFNFFTK